MTLRGGLIGCGFVSQYHLRGWARQDGARLVAVCDLDAEKARAARRFGDFTIYADAAELLRRERPDFVEICTRPEAHLPLTRLAAEHGAHVLCQKPVAPTLEALQEMTAVCARHGVRFMVHENFRWRSWYERMRQERDAGRLGTAFRLRLATHDQRCLKPDGLADQPYFADQPLLILYEMGPHALDLARSFFGEAQRVFAVCQHVGPQRGEDVAHVVLWFPGAVAHLDLSWATAGANSRPAWGLFDTALDGERGTLRTRADGQLDWLPAVGASEVLPVAIDPEPLVDCYARTQRHFVECLRSGRRFATDGDDTLQTMRAVFAAYESARTGAVVAL